MLSAVIVTFSVASFLSLILYAVDKFNAGRGAGRIPEIVLLVFCALGGAVGAFLGMTFFHHKSNLGRKWYFFGVVAVSFSVQFAVLLMAAGVLVF